MAKDLVFTFYTYTETRILRGLRCKPTGLRNFFFADLEEAKRTVLVMREDTAADPEQNWVAMNIEKIVTVPISRSSILALLNDGPEAFIDHYEVLETIQDKDKTDV